MGHKVEIGVVGDVLVCEMAGFDDDRHSPLLRKIHS